MADKKITELTAATSITGTDIIPVVTSPGSTPQTKTVTLNLLSDSLTDTTISGSLTVVSGSANISKIVVSGSIVTNKIEVPTGSLMLNNAGTNYSGYTFVPLSVPITSACFTNSTFATGTTLISASTTFSVPTGSKALAVYFTAQWNNANNAYYVNVAPYNRTDTCMLIRGSVANMSLPVYGVLPLGSNTRFNFVVAGSPCTGVYATVWGYYL